MTGYSKKVMPLNNGTANFNNTLTLSRKRLRFTWSVIVHINRSLFKDSATCCPFFIRLKFNNPTDRTNNPELGKEVSYNDSEEPVESCRKRLEGPKMPLTDRKRRV